MLFSLNFCLVSGRALALSARYALRYHHIMWYRWITARAGAWIDVKNGDCQDRLSVSCLRHQWESAGHCRHEHVPQWRRSRCSTGGLTRTNSQP